MLRYIANLDAGKIALWCYLIWYLGVVLFYFDPTPAIWLNSIGISAIIGVALILSVGGRRRIERWQTFRLFAMPFCVSSFSALIKGQGFLLIFPTDTTELLALIGACAAFVLLAMVLKRSTPESRA